VGRPAPPPPPPPAPAAPAPGGAAPPGPPPPPPPGLGIAPAAQTRGLDFIPLLWEDYYLVCLKDALQEPAVQALLALLHGEAWKGLLSTLPGYEPAQGGEVLSLRAQLPWWQFRTAKKKTL